MQEPSAKPLLEAIFVLARTMPSDASCFLQLWLLGVSAVTAIAAVAKGSGKPPYAELQGSIIFGLWTQLMSLNHQCGSHDAFKPTDIPKPLCGILLLCLNSGLPRAPSSGAGNQHGPPQCTCLVSEGFADWFDGDGRHSVVRTRKPKQIKEDLHDSQANHAHKMCGPPTFISRC